MIHHMFSRWKHGHRCAGSGHSHHTPFWHHSEEESFMSGNFGVRRPLRFLSYKLDLDEEQVTKMATILDELKTERAQAAVDERRTLAAFAESLGAETFEVAKANNGREIRLNSSKLVADAVVNALTKIHQILKPEQRERLAYLIRSGSLVL